MQSMEENSIGVKTPPLIKVSNFIVSIKTIKYKSTICYCTYEMYPMCLYIKLFV